MDVREQAQTGQNMRRAWATLEPIFDELQSELFSQFLSSVEPEEREGTYFEGRALGKLKQRMQKIITTGAVAEKQIEIAINKGSK